MEKTIQQYFEAVNSDSVDVLMDLWHENGEFFMPFRAPMRAKMKLGSFTKACQTFILSTMMIP